MSASDPIWTQGLSAEQRALGLAVIEALADAGRDATAGHAVAVFAPVLPGAIAALLASTIEVNAANDVGGPDAETVIGWLRHMLRRPEMVQ